MTDSSSSTTFFVCSSFSPLLFIYYYHYYYYHYYNYYYYYCYYYQRRCRVISGFQSDDTFEQVSEETLDNEIVLADISLNEYFELKPGVCLPRSNEEWTVANDYSKYFFTINPMDLSPIDQSIQSMNQAIYNYFRDTCGFVEEVNEELAAKYQDHAFKELKKELQLLKRNGAPVIEIKYVSRVLRQ